jgi:hypothetical protein
MRTLLGTLALGLTFVATAQARDYLKPASETGCATHGTAVQFYDSPQEAAQQARKEEKLVLVLHVSGHFEDPKLT